MSNFDILALYDKHLNDGRALARDYVNAPFSELSRMFLGDIQFVRAEGSSLYDAQGRQYLDFLCARGVMGVGHNHPVVRKAIADVVGRSLPNMLQLDTPVLSGLLARELVRMSPPELDTVFFGSSGSEGVEAALKFARCATRRPGIVSVQGAYHGLTYGALSIIGVDAYKEGFGPFQHGTQRIPFNDLGALERALSRRDVAAFVAETISGWAGVPMPDPDYWKEVRRICDKYGTLLVMDEVQTGLGRTGKFYAFEHYGVVPDLVVVAKALSGALVPISAVIGKRAVLSKTFNGVQRAMVHCSTYEGNNLSCTAGLAMLHVLREERLMENAARVGQLLKSELRRRMADFELIRDVRGEGLFIGIEFGEPRSAPLRAAWSVLSKADGIFAASVSLPLLQKHRVFTNFASEVGTPVLQLSPPLVLTEAEARQFLAAFDAQMEETHKAPAAFIEMAGHIGRLLRGKIADARDGIRGWQAPAGHLDPP